jgi:hypothetical protein
MLPYFGWAQETDQTAPSWLLSAGVSWEREIDEEMANEDVFKIEEIWIWYC